MSIFTGAGVAIVTPMKANGEVNYPKLEELLNYQIENGTACDHRLWNLPVSLPRWHSPGASGSHPFYD